MKKVLLIANEYTTIVNFRMELLTELVKSYEVVVVVPHHDRDIEIKDVGCKVINVAVERTGKNPFHDIAFFNEIKRLLKLEKPDIVFTYTIKPNIYGGLACSKLKIPYVPNITGLGDSIVSGGLLSKISLFLYKKGLKKAQTVFFQNEFNYEFMKRKGIVSNSCIVLPGSGVNLERNAFCAYPKNDGVVRFVTIGRLMKSKGTSELLDSVQIIKNKYPNTKFTFVGSYEGNFKTIVDGLVDRGIIDYVPYQKDVRVFIQESNAIIHPSYHEGMSNVLLESAAIGRPILASNIPGCKEIVDDGTTGFLFEPKNVDSLVDAIIRFVSLTYEKRLKMGRLSREKVEKQFDRKIVIDAYMKEIEKNTKEKRNETL